MNQLNVSLQHSITTPAIKGWSARKIARELGVHRETVGRYLLPTTSKSKPANPPIGLANPSDPKPANVPPGSNAGRASQCAPLSGVIEQGLLAGLSAQRIYQDLVAGHAFTSGYDEVERFVRRLNILWVDGGHTREAFAQWVKGLAAANFQVFAVASPHSLIQLL